MFPTIKLLFERWKWNKEYEIYVSTHGRFRNNKKQIIQCRIDKDGYLGLRTSKGWISAHRLVMLTWCPIANAAVMTIDHLNHNKRDNSIRNLEWVTLAENARRAKEDMIDAVVDVVIAAKKAQMVAVNGVKMTFNDAVKIVRPIAQAGYSTEKVAEMLRDGLKNNKRKIFGMEIRYV